MPLFDMCWSLIAQAIPENRLQVGGRQYSRTCVKLIGHGLGVKSINITIQCGRRVMVERGNTIA